MVIVKKDKELEKQHKQLNKKSNRYQMLNLLVLFGGIIISVKLRNIIPFILVVLISQLIIGTRWKKVRDERSIIWSGIQRERITTRQFRGSRQSERLKNK